MTDNQYNIAKEMFLNKESLRNISKKLNVDRKVLSKKLKEDGLKIVKGISNEDLLKASNEIKQGCSLTFVANKYNVDRHTLSKKLSDYNLRNQQAYSRNKNYDNQILDMYNNNFSIEKISKELNVSTNLVWLCLRDNNYKINSYKKHTCNEDIFEKIDNEEKAYWLGFLYADGYVNNNGIELTLSEIDKEHIEKFKNFLNASNNLKYKEQTKAYRLSIYSTKIAKDLTNLGCYKNKSLTLQFPTEEQVPKELIHHFMRGYFDGDGCICIPKAKYKPQRHFSVIGTKDFLDKYDEIILNLGVNKTKYSSEGQAYSVKHCGNIQVQKIYDFLYKNATIYLDRKYYKFKLPS